MHIAKAVVRNYRCLRDCTAILNEKLNIIVGDNECGKSTLLEAIHLTLSGQLNGRPLITELHPQLFNQDTVREYINGMKAGRVSPPPYILIELYFADIPQLAECKGTNNSLKENVPGVKLIIEFNEDYKTEYAGYVADPAIVRTVPVEYYAIRLRTFADCDITPRAVPIKPTLIDASTIRNNAAANRYVVDIVRDSLTRKDQVDLALSYRLMRDRFLDDAKVAAINAELAKKKGTVSNKTLSISLDTSSRTGWEAGVMPQLDEIPMTLVGKGEQNGVKVKLALESSADSHLVLIEEAENHLSHSNLNALIEHISSKRGDRQLLITTHSSFVLNKLGIESVLLFSRVGSMTLKELAPGTEDYFMKLPGHDTLRLILAGRAILVEGPSDELIVQAAFNKKHGRMPLAAGVDVISVRSLAFKRFLEVASLMDLRVDVVTDNDGDLAALRAKYDGYLDRQLIKIRYDDDVNYPTLEPQLLKANGRATLNAILGKSFQTDEELRAYMQTNKTEVALKLFETDKPWVVPPYIEAAIA
ncbi:ATP-dependent endonuclease [Mesorhizobium sp. B4-1-3]|uniref:ATP-dependent nuclease n=1 Tax=Mesorhizobium sp. B4-1-3 TaxID=2589889 RepID=UPI0011277F0F|nr:AAA family ATPase [Mesorhizobium sp. B4-1-3]TPI09920.1 ATP-dependent endonuclease [Mesorhizobium sp. B4-1-3]